MFGGQTKQLLTCIHLQGSTIGDRQVALEHTFIDDVIEKIKGISIDLLIGFVITNEGATIIR
jgi:hypothetical protein